MTVAASPVSPVSPGPLFSYLLGKACEMVANNVNKSFLSLLTAFRLLSEQLVLQASSARSVACENSEQFGRQNDGVTV